MSPDNHQRRPRRAWTARIACAAASALLALAGATEARPPAERVPLPQDGSIVGQIVGQCWKDGVLLEEMPLGDSADPEFPRRAQEFHDRCIRRGGAAKFVEGHTAPSETTPGPADDAPRPEQPLVPPPEPRLSIGDAGMREGRRAVFAAHLSHTISRPVTVDYATLPGSARSRADFRPAAGTLTFAPGELSKRIVVAVRDDRRREGAESFLVHLDAPEGAALTRTWATATIQDDEPNPKRRCCTGKALSKKQVYSRGNNDAGQMIEQRNKPGSKTYQNETASIAIQYAADPSSCTCREQKCDGAIELGVTMTVEIKSRQDNVADPDEYVMLDGVEATGTTEQEGSKAPGPDVETTSDTVDLPAARKENGFGKVTPDLFQARAKAKIPCSAGRYVRRFHLVRAERAGKKKTPGKDPRLASYIDAIVTVKEAECELALSMKGYYLDYAPNWDFTTGRPGADRELPEVKYTVPGVGKGTTSNLGKLVEEDGKAIDTPFPPR